MNKTTKYDNMISAFQCDFSLARDGDMRLITLDKLIKENNPSLLYDIELLEELEMGLRYGRLAIVELEDGELENNVFENVHINKCYKIHNDCRPRCMFLNGDICKNVSGCIFD